MLNECTFFNRFSRHAFGMKSNVGYPPPPPRNVDKTYILGRASLQASSQTPARLSPHARSVATLFTLFALFLSLSPTPAKALPEGVFYCHNDSILNVWTKSEGTDIAPTALCVDDQSPANAVNIKDALGVYMSNLYLDRYDYGGSDNPRDLPDPESLPRIPNSAAGGYNSQANLIASKGIFINPEMLATPYYNYDGVEPITEYEGISNWYGQHNRLLWAFFGSYNYITLRMGTTQPAYKKYSIGLPEPVETNSVVLSFQNTKNAISLTSEFTIIDDAGNEIAFDLTFKDQDLLLPASFSNGIQQPSLSWQRQGNVDVGHVGNQPVGLTTGQQFQVAHYAVALPDIINLKSIVLEHNDLRQAPVGSRFVRRVTSYAVLKPYYGLSKLFDLPEGCVVPEGA